MLSEKSVREFAVKYQTSEANVAREYFQHLFLSGLYSLREAEGLTFKGGTALRIIYGSPRFSEDLDFSGRIRPFTVKNVIAEAVEKVRQENIRLELAESGETSGGYLAILRTELLDFNLYVKLNISLKRRKNGIREEAHLIASDLFPAYNLTALGAKFLVREKLQALISRKKPRDLFDLYFIIRNRLETGEAVARKKEILSALESVKGSSLGELKLFLPKSYWNLLPGFVPRLTDVVKNL